MRGVVHLAAAVIAPFALFCLLLRAHSPAGYAGGFAFGIGLIGLFGVSAAYHVGTWGPRVRPIVQRLDHSMIFVAVAAFHTPFCLQVMEPAWGIPGLVAVWSAAVAGCLFKQFWFTAPTWLGVAAYLAIGWLGLAVLPGLVPQLSLVTASALVGAGLLFSAGGVIYGLRRPSPLPRVFGYHEVFHTLVALGCAVLYTVVFVDVLPR